MSTSAEEVPYIAWVPINRVGPATRIMLAQKIINDIVIAPGWVCLEVSEPGGWRQ